MRTIVFEEMAFDDWVRTRFDHPETLERIQFGNVRRLPPAETIAYLTRLFENAGALLVSYSDAQVAVGLDGILDWELGEIGDESVPLAERLHCLRAIHTVYTDIFVPRCTEHLGHYSEKMSRLNGVCYMWWELGCWISVRDAALVETVVDVLGQILALPHAACQESALHGLGHWGLYFSEATAPPIDAFLEAKAARRPELVVYAQNARRSVVL